MKRTLLLTVHLSAFHLPGQSILRHFKQVRGARRCGLALGSASWSLLSASERARFVEPSALLCDRLGAAALRPAYFDGSTYLNIVVVVVVVWLLCKHSKVPVSGLVGNRRADSDSRQQPEVTTGAVQMCSSVNCWRDQAHTIGNYRIGWAGCRGHLGFSSP